ncbi:MAG TPA: pilus assembly protein TadG-related protein [Pyrinomonadaceae bacterium]|nr:pilus assembly protein TadG-related protein [Pyrinomonadaceae bacterium]
MTDKLEHVRGGGRGERGSVLALSAVGMVIFLAAVGLCVDVSHFYLVNAELQNAADAAALAGASALNSQPVGITNAVTRATEELTNNYEFNNKEAEIGPENVTFAVNLDGPYMSADEADDAGTAEKIRFVKVVVPPKAVGVFFAQLALNTDTVNMSREATAGMSMPPNVFCDWIPLTVIEDSADKLIPGQTYTLRAAPQNSVSSGNYQILAVNGRGGEDVREDIAKGIKQCAKPGDEYTIDTKPGVSAGAVRQGINTRFDEYHAGMDPVTYPPDPNIKEYIRHDEYGKPGYQQPPSHDPVPGRRLVLVPIVSKDQFQSGRDTVTFDRFALFFLRTKVGNGNGGDFEAEYVELPTAYGAGAYAPGGGPVTPSLAMPVIYR